MCVCVWGGGGWEWKEGLAARLANGPFPNSVLPLFKSGPDAKLFILKLVLIAFELNLIFIRKTMLQALL